MHDFETLKNGGYRDAGLTQLKLACPLTSLPEEILELGETLEHLDLSGTGLCSLPTNLGAALPNLKIALFSNCKFRVFPKELSSCPNLETVAFRSNGMEEIPEDVFPPRLRCLILTGNRLTFLPSSIGRCDRLQKCMLAGNQLRDLPQEMGQCKQLAVLRLSANRLSTLPPWVFTLPKLGFLSFANNPCASPTTNGLHTPRGLANIAWSDLEVQQTLDSNTSQALWHQSPHYSEDVAIKLFRGSLTSDDNSAADEMAACLAAGAHESLTTILGRIHGHPDEDITSITTTTTTTTSQEEEFQGGIVTQRIPDHYAPLLDQPPRPPPQQQQQGEEREAGSRMDVLTALGMLTGLAGAAAQLHARGIAHGNLCAANILASSEDAHALLVGFGAATMYHGGCGQRQQQQQQQQQRGGAVEKVEVLAFGQLVEDVLGLVDNKEESGEVESGLWELRARCVAPEVEARPGFEEVVEALEGMMGWRGMMRIPDVNPS
ncbi:hypothetical protein C8A00DRAFT_43103 [Chaetomidium leptoderma]|uniref:Protein kinase domain-containing protein n=1 Tax=Chaetomidium leptoderma TaxID=669021 RepID=A0AAN6VMS5_9PEZI|nr:hypothetical protein C8A00DRAFT_43103 [Chaetomidium leptoderma]